MSELDQAKCIRLNKDELVENARAMSVADLQKSVKEIQARVGKALEEGGPELDTSKMKSIMSEGDKDGLEALQKFQDEANIKSLVLEQKYNVENVKRAILHDAEELAERRFDGEAEVVLPGEGRQPQDLGTQFVNSESYRNGLEKFNDHTSWAQRGVGFETPSAVSLIRGEPRAAVMTRAAGWDPEVIRSGQLVLSEQKPVEMLDLLPIIRISATDGYRYMQETTFTSGADAKAEGGAVAESALALTEQTVSVEKIGAYLPVTDEQMADVSGVRDYVNSRLSFQVRADAGEQALNGNNTSPNWQGIYSASGVNTVAKTDAIALLDIYLKARVAVRKAARVTPNVMLCLPDYYELIFSAKDSQNRYLFGNPFMTGDVMRLWGMRIVENETLAANTGMVFDTMQTALILRDNVMVDVGYIDKDFIKSQVSIRAILRGNVAVFRPKGVCTITALNT